VSKKRISGTIDQANFEWLEAHTDNKSAFINDLLTRARQNEDAIDHIVARYRKEQLRAELATVEARKEGIEEQLAELSEMQRRRNNREEAEFDQALEALEGVPPEPSNPAVQNWAKKLDTTPQAVAEELEASD